MINAIHTWFVDGPGVGVSVGLLLLVMACAFARPRLVP